MPIEYQIDKAAGIVHTQVVGELTDAETLAYQGDLRGDPDFDPSYREFFDLSEVKPFRVTSDGLRKWVLRCPWGEGAKRAFVARHDLEFGMLRMYQSLMGGQKVAVFRTASEAWRWLEPNKE